MDNVLLKRIDWNATSEEKSKIWEANNERYKELGDEREVACRNQCLAKARSLREAILARVPDIIEGLPPPSPHARGAAVLDSGRLTGPNPIACAADYLEILIEDLTVTERASANATIAAPVWSGQGKRTAPTLREHRRHSSSWGGPRPRQQCGRGRRRGEWSPSLVWGHQRGGTPLNFLGRMAIGGGVMVAPRRCTSCARSANLSKDNPS